MINLTMNDYKFTIFFLGLERLCACTDDGALYFFVTSEEEGYTEEKDDIEDVNMIIEEGCTNVQYV